MSALPTLLAALFVVTALFSADAPSSGGLQEFGPVSETGDEGWLLAGGRIYWTTDAGTNWRDITPPEMAGSEIAAAAFVEHRGRVIAASARSDGTAAYRLASTEDAGATWQQRDLDLFEAGEPGLYPGALYLDFIDPQHGWLVVKHQTSSNFSTGDLFRTTNSGATWERLAIPIGEPVRFENEHAGAVSGGPTGNEAYLTTDGGASWQSVAPNVAATTSGLAMPRQDIATVARGPGQAAWAAYRRGFCEPGTKRCRVEEGLLSTSDAGQTWRTVPVPEGAAWSAAAGVEQNTVSLGPHYFPQMLPAPRTRAMVGHGFDKCEVADPLVLLDWSLNSPYDAVNLYVGGAARACSNRALSPSLLRTLANQGWRFIPTWVGPQAPCYGNDKIRMSADPATAYYQGRAEADMAADRLAQLDLTEPDGTGSIVYYDMEYYNTLDSACHEAVKSFISGWVQVLHGRGNIAGVYGTGATLSGFANQPEPPDAIWAANWIRNSFDPSVTVRDVYRLSNDLWVNHQRLRQYTGGHAETWGYNSLTIDSDVLDGIVAALPPPVVLSSKYYVPFVVR